MKKIDIEIWARISINQTMIVTDKEFETLQDGTEEEIFNILDSKINLDYVTELKDIEVWDLEEVENDSN